MTIRTFTALGLLTSSLVFAAHGAAQPSKAVDARVEKIDAAGGTVRAALGAGSVQNVLPGDKGFFLKDGAKVAGSEFEIDRVEERLASAPTHFSSPEEARSQTSMRARVTTTHSCPRGGARPKLDHKEALQGEEPAEGFVFANVTSTERVHKTRIAFTIDKGADDGVLPQSSAYGALAGAGRLPSGYVHITWVSAKTAGGIVDAGDADKLAATVKRIAFEHLVCTPAK